MDKKRLVGLVILVILVVAIPLTIYLVQQTQIFKPRADETDVVSKIKVYQGGTEIIATSSAVPAIVTDPNVQLKIYYVPSPSPLP